MNFDESDLVTSAYGQYGDFAGTAASDTHGGGTRELAAKIGLDDDRYWIVGIDVWGNDLATARLNILAVDRQETGIDSYKTLEAHHRESGAIPVVEFLVHEMSAVDVLRVGLKRLNFQLLSRSLPDGAHLYVHERSDLNYQGD
ncbi:hypothetical protein [Microbacterium esteraromaticum]|uniref:hypothetical protein n=1 Tax=Microbacterium esteraromaticum TaxID=57043 RepID=UPI00195637C3|nr:hypothetical protein [Microbacterium esteraromaticum]MBM7466100.1 hypothetical protein [Microbacterium esteraromaticum]